MFFTLSKLLYFLIRPVNWLFLLLILAWHARRAQWRKRYLIAAIVLLTAGSNELLFNAVAKWWEMPSSPIRIQDKPYDVGILLGGFSNPYGWPVDGRFHPNSSASRLTQTLELYQQDKIRKILITGGWSKLLAKETTNEARSAKEFLIRCGVPAIDILIEPNSRNTWENADYSKHILQSESPGGRCLLITSAWHMKRALACFRKAGINPDVYCADYFQEGARPWWEMAFRLDPGLFSKWEALIKEWIGILAYRIKGYN